MRPILRVRRRERGRIVAPEFAQYHAAGERNRFDHPIDPRDPPSENVVTG